MFQVVQPTPKLGSEDNELPVLSPSALTEVALAFAEASVRSLERPVAGRIAEVASNLNAKDLTRFLKKKHEKTWKNMGKKNRKKQLGMKQELFFIDIGDPFFSGQGLCSAVALLPDAFGGNQLEAQMSEAGEP